MLLGRINLTSGEHKHNREIASRSYGNSFSNSLRKLSTVSHRLYISLLVFQSSPFPTSTGALVNNSHPHRLTGISLMISEVKNCSHL